MRVGCSISSVSTKFYEPGVVSVSTRVETLRKLHENGIVTWVSMAPIIPQLILQDLDLLLRKLKRSGVSCVAFGMLRFVGYEESRVMFETRTRRSSEHVSVGENEVYDKVSKLVHKYELGNSRSILDWQEKCVQAKTLDDY